MIVDAHHHLWDLTQVRYPWLEARGVRRFFGDPTSIRKDYSPEDFREDWDGVPVSASVHVQVGAGEGQELHETAWLEEQAQATGLPSAFVAYADLTSDALEETLSEHAAASERLRGVRQIVSRHPSEDAPEDGVALLRSPAFAWGLRVLAERGLSFDLQLTPPLLQTAAEVFGSVPGLEVALCHAGSPWERDREGLKQWRDGLAAFAELPNSVCKLSGLGMFDPHWTAKTLAPIAEGVLHAFGADRVMWGSNFPVDKLYRGYRDTFDALRQAVPEHARDRVFGLNAARFYRLAQSDEAG